MSIKTIITEPNKILRQKSKDVISVGRDEQKLMDDMLDTMYAANGIGLAAIQAGIQKRIVGIDLKSGLEDINLRDPHVFVNPKILKKSGLTVSEEGCLSVIDFRGNVDRAEKISVEYQDVKGLSLIHI